MPKSIAARLRTLARNAEKIETCVNQLPPEQRREHKKAGARTRQNPFTCNAVDEALGCGAHRAYRDTLMPFYDENDLWRQPDFASIRVLLLCFAAAMAETGDL